MSGLIPRAFLDELLHRTDIVDLINSYIPLKKRGNSFLACCPFHTEKTPSFNVLDKKQFYHCFGCGASGNAISFVMNHLGHDFVETVDLLASRLGLSVPRENGSDKQNHSADLYQLLAKITIYYQNALKKSPAAVSYLQQRGINGLIARHYQLGFALPGWNHLDKHFRTSKNELLQTGMLIKKDNGQCYDRYRERIMFPIHDKKGRLIAFGGRVINNNEKPKYLNSPESPIFQKNRELYGLYQAIQANNILANIIIVEGYLDVIALAQHGITNAVATLGTATSTYHIQLLSKYTQQIIFCFDGDEAGRQAAWKALESCLPHIEGGLDVRFIFLPDDQDPDSLVRQKGATGFTSYLNNATPLNDYFIDTLSRDCNLQIAAGKSQLISLAAPYINLIPEGSYKQLLIDELSRKTHLESHRISQIITNPNTEEASIIQKSISRSPTRLAIALLLQHPEIYFTCKEFINLNSLDGKGQEIIRQIIEYIEKNPKINTAGLIEQWRDDSQFNSIVKLAAWEHLVPENALIDEFKDIINFLQKQNLEIKINIFLEKSRKEGLTTTEQQLLQQFVQQRHKPH